jgi:L-ascorbate metabolism protein UlaG (beta-lactamase superfamily)
MMKSTYLGHQGWLFQAGRGSLLVDPLFFPEFGRGPPGGRFAVYPPCAWRRDLLPPIDAVFLTHEHEDHLHIPTLATLPRHLPVHLSARSSRAARQILEDLGFPVRLVPPGGRLQVGDLAVTAFGPDHTAQTQLDEWDTLAFLVAERGGDGAFFTNVDVYLTDEMVEAARAGARGGALDLLYFAGGVLQLWQAFDGARPGPDRDWVEDAPALARLLAARGKARPLPGQTFVSTGGRLSVVQPATFLSAWPRARWPEEPPLRFEPAARDYAPASSVHTLSDDELAELADGLDQLAGFLHGGDLFRRLYSLPPAAPELRPTFCLVLLTGNGDEALTLEYDPQGCRFALATAEDPYRSYVGGLECWASDLLALMRGRFEPRIVTQGRCRHWWHGPAKLDPDLGVSLLWLPFHPLRQPEQTYRRYRQVLDAVLAETPELEARAP